MADVHTIARTVRGCATDEQYTELTARIEAAVRAAENDALERAAKASEDYDSSDGYGDNIADAIRALKKGEPT